MLGSNLDHQQTRCIGTIDMKYLSIYPEWNFKKSSGLAGALFFGIKLDFPTEIYDSEAFASMHTYTRFRLTFGLIVCSVKVDIKYNYIKMLPI